MAGSHRAPTVCIHRPTWLTSTASHSGGRTHAGGWMTVGISR